MHSPTNFINSKKRRNFLKFCYGGLVAFLARAMSARAADNPPIRSQAQETSRTTASAQLFSLPENVVTRWASPENPTGAKGAGALTGKGRKGRPCLPIARGKQVILAEASGSSGIVRRIWLTSKERSPNILRGMRLDIYWDGSATPGVSAPLGDFFGQGLGRCQTFESAFFSNPEGRSFNCTLPMPFQTGFRIVLTNESPDDAHAIFYDVDYTLGDVIESPSYLHAHWRRENPTTLGRDFEVLPLVKGRGRYLGANFSVVVDRKSYLDSWWGEGETKIFLDGDGDHPSLVGTGTEDYIGTAWGQGKYANLNQGSHLNDSAHGMYAFYRYHVPDPVYFSQEIRVTYQQIGGAFGGTIHQILANGQQVIRAGGVQTGVPLDLHWPEKDFACFERQDDWSSCCYFYLDKPENGLPLLAPVEERIGGLSGDTPPATPTNAG